MRFALFEQNEPLCRTRACPFAVPRGALLLAFADLGEELPFPEALTGWHT